MSVHLLKEAVHLRWIDDLRFYRIALHPRDILESYGRGSGDFGVTPTFLVNRAISEMPLSVTVSFWDKNPKSYK